MSDRLCIFKTLRHQDRSASPGIPLLFWLLLSVLLHGALLLLELPAEKRQAANATLPLHVTLRPPAEPQASFPVAPELEPAAHFPNRRSHPKTSTAEPASAPAASAPTGAAEDHPEPPPIAAAQPFPPATAPAPILATADAALLLEAIPLRDNNPPPVYPLLARQRGWQGLVLLQVQVSSGGEVQNLWVEGSSGYALLDQAALAAVRRWRFQPAQMGGEKVAGMVRVPIAFELRGP